MQPRPAVAVQSCCMSKFVKRILACSLSMLLIGVIASAQQPPRDLEVLDQAYLAKDDGSGTAGEKAETFKPTDVPIHCIVMLDTEQPQQVKINFIAVRVAGVRPNTNVVSAAYTTKQGQTRVSFTGRPEGKWMPGAYRVDVFIDGKMIQSLNMNVEGQTASPSAKYLVPASGRQLPKKTCKHIKNPYRFGPGSQY
jgi:hypothetical protein